jgi:hypothetical protein
MTANQTFLLGNRALTDPCAVSSYLDDLATASAKAPACFSSFPQLLDCLINKKCIASGNEEMLGEKIVNFVKKSILPGWKLIGGRSEHKDGGRLNIRLRKVGVKLELGMSFVIAESSLKGMVEDCGNILKANFVLCSS